MSFAENTELVLNKVSTSIAVYSQHSIWTLPQHLYTLFLRLVLLAILTSNCLKDIEYVFTFYAIKQSWRYTGCVSLYIIYPMEE